MTNSLERGQTLSAVRPCAALLLSLGHMNITAAHSLDPSHSYEEVPVFLWNYR